MWNGKELKAMEKIATSKYPKKGKCKNTCFANGHHRIGIIDTECVLDGGAAGNICKEICLECGKEFEQLFRCVAGQKRNL